MFHEINVSPFATNVLDLIGRNDLSTYDKRRVTVESNYPDFTLTIGSQTITAHSNLDASYILNSACIGVWKV